MVLPESVDRGGVLMTGTYQYYQTEIAKYEQAIVELKKKIDELQERCPHERGGESTFVRCKPSFEIAEKCAICGKLRGNAAWK
jgi:hypothetical protein